MEGIQFGKRCNRTDVGCWFFTQRIAFEFESDAPASDNGYGKRIHEGGVLSGV